MIRGGDPLRVLAAPHLRSYAPASMNVDVRVESALRFASASARSAAAGAEYSKVNLQLKL